MSDLSTETDLAACRGRQRRLIEVMERLDVDLAIVTQTEHVQYLVGPRFRRCFSPAAALARDGRLTLVAPADFQRSGGRRRNRALRGPMAVARCATISARPRRPALWQALGPIASGRRIGVEYSSCGLHVTQDRDAQWIDIEPELYRLRRRKDPDELARLKRAIAATAAMYARAREIIMPGINELDVFSELQAAAVPRLRRNADRHRQRLCLGRQRRACRAIARSKPASCTFSISGPAYRGYFADNCRVHCRQPRADAASSAGRGSRSAAAFPIVEQMVKPGVRCRDSVRGREGSPRARSSPGSSIITWGTASACFRTKRPTSIPRGTTRSKRAK